MNVTTRSRKTFGLETVEIVFWVHKVIIPPEVILQDQRGEMEMSPGTDSVRARVSNLGMDWQTDTGYDPPIRCASDLSIGVKVG